MVHEDIFKFIYTIPSYKVRHYLQTYVELLNHSFGKMFDIVLAHGEIDEEQGHILFYLELLVKTDVTLIYGQPNQHNQIPINSDINDIYYFKPSDTHSRPMTDGSVDVSKALSNRISTVVSRMDRFTTLEGVGISCCTYVDRTSFNSQLFFQDQIANLQSYS